MSLVNKNAFLQQSGMVQSFKGNQVPENNSYNIVRLKDPNEVKSIVKEQLGVVPFRLSPTGYMKYSDAYEKSTKLFLEGLSKNLGVRNTAFITSPTAMPGSIDSICSEVSGLDSSRLLYVTAQEYEQYINAKDFGNVVNSPQTLMQYEKIPKYTLPTTDAYSKATANAANVYIATGGRNDTVRDFTNAIENGNKCIILNNSVIDSPCWDTKKNRVDNAGKYLDEQITAFLSNKPLPHPTIGAFNENFLKNNEAAIRKLVKIIPVDGNNPADVIEKTKVASKFIL